MFNGYIHYKWQFSIAMFVYQRVWDVCCSLYEPFMSMLLRANLGSKLQIRVEGFKNYAFWSSHFFILEMYFPWLVAENRSGLYPAYASRAFLGPWIVSWTLPKMIFSAPSRVFGPVQVRSWLIPILLATRIWSIPVDVGRREALCWRMS